MNLEEIRTEIDALDKQLLESVPEKRPVELPDSA